MNCLKFILCTIWCMEIVPRDESHIKSQIDDYMMQYPSMCHWLCFCCEVSWHDLWNEIWHLPKHKVYWLFDHKGMALCKSTNIYKKTIQTYMIIEVDGTWENGLEISLKNVFFYSPKKEFKCSQEIKLSHQYFLN